MYIRYSCTKNSDKFITFIAVDLQYDTKLKASKLSSSCIKASWIKKESGSCKVKYELLMKDGSGQVKYRMNVDNVNELKKCDIPKSVDITNVELNITSRKIYRLVSVAVQRTTVKTNTGNIFLTIFLTDYLGPLFPCPV